jgi:hypothetical protein
VTKKIVQKFAKIHKKFGPVSPAKTFFYKIVEKALARFRATWAAFKGTLAPT